VGVVPFTSNAKDKVLSEKSLSMKALTYTVVYSILHNLGISQCAPIQLQNSDQSDLIRSQDVSPCKRLNRCSARGKQRQPSTCTGSRLRRWEVVGLDPRSLKWAQGCTSAPR